MIIINDHIQLPEDELQWQFIRAGGPGGQHVNKVSSAVQLVLDIRASSLPDVYKNRLLALSDHRISKSGKIIIKCQESRSQSANREMALEQLLALIQSVAVVRKKRIASKPSRAARQRRLDYKKKRGAVKATRGKPPV